MEAGLPDSVRKAVEESYRALCAENDQAAVAVAVRSSATAEDLPTASFAGQQSSFLNVVGATGVADAVLECLASVFTDRAITYRVHNKFDHMAVKVKLASAVDLLEVVVCLISFLILTFSDFTTGCRCSSDDGAIRPGLERGSLYVGS